MMQATVKTPQKQPQESGNSFRDQVMLTVKVLLITGGMLGLLALVEWIVAT